MIALKCDFCSLKWEEDREKGRSLISPYAFLCSRCGSMGTFVIIERTPFVKGEIMENQTVVNSEITHRFGYRKTNATTEPLHDECRQQFQAFAMYLNRILPESRAKSVTFTELENCSMWANKAIAEIAPLVEPKKSSRPQPSAEDYTHR